MKDAMKDAKNDANTNTDKVEGEGSYEATHRYNQAVEKHARSGDADELAKKAAEALDGPDAGELKRAEEAGKRGPRKS